MSPAPRSRRFLSKAALLLGSVLLAGLIGEVAVRVMGLGRYERPKVLAADGTEIADLSDMVRVFGTPKPGEPWTREIKPGTLVYGWYDRPKWAYFDSRGRVEYRINSYGLRDAEFPRAKRPDELRLLAIGDSFTFGSGVRSDDCWVQVLERGLAKTRRGPVEVINGGFSCGYRPDMYAVWAPGKGLELDPDCIIVGLCLNDVSLNVPLVLAPPDPEPLLGGRSQLVALAQRALARLKSRSEPMTFDLRRALGDPPVDWLLCQHGLRAIRDGLAPHGVRFIVAVFPMLTRLEAGYPFTEIHELVRAFCESEGIEHVDLLPRFLGRDEHELWVHPTDQHPNDVGHRLIGEGILEYLASERNPPHPPDERPALVPRSVLEEASVHEVDVAFANGWRLVGVEQRWPTATRGVVTAFWDLSAPGQNGFEAFVQVGDANAIAGGASRTIARPRGRGLDGRLLTCTMRVEAPDRVPGQHVRLGTRTIGGGKELSDHSPHTRTDLPDFGRFMVILPPPKDR